MKKILLSLFVVTSLISCSQDNILTNDHETLAIKKDQNKNAKDAAQKLADRIVKRYYSSQKKKHFYGVSTMPIGSNPNQLGWTFEGDAFALSQNYSGISSQQVYSLVNPNTSNLDNLVTASYAEVQSAQNQGYVIAETLGYSSDPNGLYTYPIYRYYSPSQNDHFYTSNINELGPSGSQGYIYEGIAFYGGGL